MASKYFLQIGMKAARDESGLKQTELAKILGVSLNTYVDWEKERKPLPSKDKANEFSEAVGIPLSHLRIRYITVSET